MSLTTSSICLSTYIGIPSEVANLIATYAGSISNKWIPRIDSITGKLSFIVNESYYTELLYILSTRPFIVEGVREHTIMTNGVNRYNATTYLQQCGKVENDIEVSIYSTVEVSPEVFDYYFIVYLLKGFRRVFRKGTIHRASGISEKIWMFSIQDNEMMVRTIPDDEDEIDWTF